MTEANPGFTLDHRTLAALAREVEAGDPIAWGADRARPRHGLRDDRLADRRGLRRLRSRRRRRDRQMVIALATVVKLTVENFVLHQRLMHAR